MIATLGNLNTAIDKVSNKDEEAVDFLIMGPGLSNKQSLKQKQTNLSIANTRKDCIACIGPIEQIWLALVMQPLKLLT